MEDNSLEVETTNDIREIIELNAAHQEIEAFDAEIETTAEDVEVIQNVQEVVAKAAEGEGLSPASAELAEVVLESLYGRLGIPKKSIMSLEAYGDPKQRRQELTRVACESMTDTLVRIWTAIKEAIAKLWQNIKMFVAKIFSSVKMVRNELDRMKAKIEEFSKDREFKTGELDNSALCKAFSINGKADPSTAQVILDTHIELAKRFSEFGKICEKNLDLFARNADNFLREDITDESLGRVRDGVKEMVIGFRKSAFPLKVNIKGQEGFFGTPQLVGGKHYGLDGNNKYISGLHDTTSNLRPNIFTSPEKPAASISTLDARQMSSMIGTCEKLCDQLDEMEKKQSEITKFDKEVSKILDTIIQRVKTGRFDKLNNDEKWVVTLLQNTARNLSHAYGSFTTMLPKLSIEAVRYSLNYIRASLSFSTKVEMSDDKSAVPA